MHTLGIKTLECIIAIYVLLILAYESKYQEGCDTANQQPSSANRVFSKEIS